MKTFENDWAIATCAVTGRVHMAKNLPCQDKTYSVFKNGVSIIALADGAGSARLSHFGAEIATFKICEILASYFDSLFDGNENEIKKQILSELLNSLNKKADELKCDLKELSNTLLASKNALNEMKLQREVLNGIDGFLLLSDGAEHSLYHKKEKRLAAALFGITSALRYVAPKEIEMGLKQSFESVVAMATSDDCSIAMMSKKSAYAILDNETKMDFLGIASYKAVVKSDKILAFLSRPRTLKQISRHINLKQKIAKKHVLRLCKLELIRFKNGFVFFS